MTKAAKYISRDDIRKRLEAIGKIFIQHDETKRTFKELRNRLDFHTSGSCSKLTLMLAPSGAGKTSAIKDFRTQQMIAAGGLDIDATDILYASLPPDCTIKAMTERLLVALGDPLPSHLSTASRNSNRIVQLITGKGYRLVIIDEFQHLIDADRAKVAAVTTDWLKDVLDRTNTPVVCVGLPRAIQVIRSNEQLERRTTKIITMSEFTWIEEDRDEPAERPDANHPNIKFRAFLNTWEKSLPFVDRSNLGNEQMARAIYLASGGLIGRIAQLISEASRVSMEREDGIDALIMEDFAEAFDTLPIGGLNPFDMDAPPKPKYLGEKAFNNRGNSRKGRGGKDLDAH